MADVRVFLKVQGVPGESAAPGYQGWIDVVAHSFLKEGVQRFGSSSKPKDREDKLSVTLRRGKHSPVLHQANASGKHFASLQLDVKVGTRVQHYRLNDVTVSGFSEKGPDGGDPHPAHHAIFAAVDDFDTTGSPDAISGPSKLADSGKSPPTPSGGGSTGAGSTGLRKAMLHIHVVDEKGNERVPQGKDAVYVDKSLLKYDAANGFVHELTGKGDLAVHVVYENFAYLSQPFHFDAPAARPTLVAFWSGSNEDAGSGGPREQTILACMTLNRAAGGIDDQRSPKVFHLTVTLYPTRAYVAVAGCAYWESAFREGVTPHSSGSFDFDQYSVTFAEHLLAAGTLNLSSPFYLLDCQRGRIELWHLARGGFQTPVWKRKATLERFTPCPKFPRVDDFKVFIGALKADPLKARQYLGAPHIYHYLTLLGVRIPGKVVDFSIFSHAFHGGPVLFNTNTDSTVARRAAYDLDMRYYHDFRKPNTDNWSTMNNAFAVDAKIRVWGCFDTDEFDKEARFLASNPKPDARFRYPRSVDRNRFEVQVDLRRQMEDMSYMARIAKFTGRPTYGGVPGFGADIQSYKSMPKLVGNRRGTVSGQALYVPIVFNDPRIRAVFESAELGAREFNEFGYMLYKP